MPKYLFAGSYTQAGLSGLIKDGGAKRRAAVEQLVAGLGGQLEAFYFSLGKDDFLIIADLPSNVEAATASLLVSATGAIQGHLTVLMTPAEIDAAAQGTINYRPPGQ